MNALIYTKSKYNYSTLFIIGIFISFLVVVPVYNFQFNNNTEQSDESKDTGKNGKHANQKAKQSAKEKYDQVKNEYDNLNKKPNKSKPDKDLLKKLEKQLKHWKQKMNFTGENHSQTPKGN